MFYIFKYKLNKRLHFNYSDIKTLFLPIIDKTNYSEFVGIIHNIDDSFKKGKFFNIRYKYDINITYILVEEKYLCYFSDISYILNIFDLKQNYIIKYQKIL